MNELATHSKTRILETYIELKEDYQLRSNLVGDENSDLLVDSYIILNKWKNYSSQLLNMHRVSDVMHM
jgi:hypothetical protein